MRRSSAKSTHSLLPKPKSAARLDLFVLSSRPKLNPPKKTPQIWHKQKRSPGHWPILVFIVFSFLLVVAAVSNASPPRSRGARPIALGNAYTAVSGDVYSLFYNPAGLFDLNQKEWAFDYGRSNSVGEASRSDFNVTYGMPFRWKDRYVPLAFGFYGEQAAPGAHIIDMTVGGGSDAPMERWTRGIIKFPVKLGGALTIRHQNGEDRSRRVGGSTIGLGLTMGLYAPVFRNHQFGFVIRHLYAGDGDAKGASAHLGVRRHHKKYLNLYGELEYARGGVWRFHPGMEWLFLRGVLRPRLGWGYRDNAGIDTLATGVGFYLSPVQLDISYLIPLKTLSDTTDQMRVSLVYRFGQPQFTEIYFDRALEAASQLDGRVMGLMVKEAELKSSVGELEQKNRLAQEELENARKRIELLKDQDVLGERDQAIKKLKARVKKLESALGSSRRKTKALQKKRASIRTHDVKAGDTLQSIAREYYGDPNQWKKIYNRNPDKVDRGIPRTGERLIIP